MNKHKTDTIFSPLLSFFIEAKKSYGQISDFLWASAFHIRLYYVNVVGLCEGHVVLFADQRDRSGDCGGEKEKNIEGKKYEPKANSSLGSNYTTIQVGDKTYTVFKGEVIRKVFKKYLH